MTSSLPHRILLSKLHTCYFHHRKFTPHLKLGIEVWHRWTSQTSVVKVKQVTMQQVFMQCFQQCDNSIVVEGQCMNRVCVSCVTIFLLWPIFILWGLHDLPPSLADSPFDTFFFFFKELYLSGNQCPPMLNSIICHFDCLQIRIFYLGIGFSSLYLLCFVFIDTAFIHGRVTSVVWFKEVKKGNKSFLATK